MSFEDREEARVVRVEILLNKLQTQLQTEKALFSRLVALNDRDQTRIDALKLRIDNLKKQVLVLIDRNKTLRRLSTIPTILSNLPSV